MDMTRYGLPYASQESNTREYFGGSNLNNYGGISQMWQQYIKSNNDEAILALFNRSADYIKYINNSGVSLRGIEETILLSKHVEPESECYKCSLAWEIRSYVEKTIGVEKPNGNLDELIARVLKFIDNLNSFNSKDQGYSALSTVLSLHDFEKAINSLDHHIDKKSQAYLSAVDTILDQLGTIGKSTSPQALRAVYKINNDTIRKQKIYEIMQVRVEKSKNFIIRADEVNLLAMVNQQGVPHQHDTQLFFQPVIKEWINELWNEQTISSSEDLQQRINKVSNFLEGIKTSPGLIDYGLIVLAALVKDKDRDKADAIVRSISSPYLKSTILSDFTNSNLDYPTNKTDAPYSEKKVTIGEERIVYENEGHLLATFNQPGVPEQSDTFQSFLSSLEIWINEVWNEETISSPQDVQPRINKVLHFLEAITTYPKLKDYGLGALANLVKNKDRDKAYAIAHSMSIPVLKAVIFKSLDQ